MVLEVQNLSKRYQLGAVTARTISLDLHRWFARMHGKYDPTMDITSKNVLERRSKTEFIWALRNISFRVGRGERIGIIGKNGSGKSTLLKIISRITSPTEGVVKLNGKVGSLLEVGTGFDPEMTGIENIYFYGSILGMGKSAIKRNLEEIIDFSGCESYINTPIKRYSSGMKIRLAFSVGTFLDADILILDEVLEVGDQKFTKKAIKKIKELATDHDKTIIFVSHNLDTIKNITNKCIFLNSGQVVSQGETSEIINEYLMFIDTYKNFSNRNDHK